ncbi:MAG: hypothetical protein ABI352_05620, partial [Candidatus Dormibacter sp.]
MGALYPANALAHGRRSVSGRITYTGKDFVSRVQGMSRKWLCGIGVSESQSFRASIEFHEKLAEFTDHGGVTPEPRQGLPQASGSITT